MANSHITAAWERALDASGSDLLVLLSLADQANDDGWCWPGQGSLVRRTRVSRATVQRATERLVEQGYIEVHPRPGYTNVYRITIDRVPQNEAPPLSDPSGGGASSGEAPPASSGEAGVASSGEARTPNNPHREPPSDIALTCDEYGCNKPGRHRGAHRNPWWDAIEVALGYKAPEHQASRFGKLATRAKTSGFSPDQIIDAAAWIASEWGPEKLTLNSLNEHLERALSQISRLTGRDVEAYQAERSRLERRERMGLDAEEPGRPNLALVQSDPTTRERNTT